MDNAVSVRAHIPVAVRVLQPGFFATAIVHERAFNGVRVVEAYCLFKVWDLFLAVNVNAILHVMVDLKQHELIDKVPVAAQTLVCTTAKIHSLLVCQMSFWMNQADNAIVADVFPRLFHKATIEIRLGS